MKEIEEKICISCGMPMRKEADFAANDPSKDYCIYCANEDGSLKSYEEKKADTTDFIVKTQGFERSAAEKVAEESLSKQPAWKK